MLARTADDTGEQFGFYPCHRQLCTFVRLSSSARRVARCRTQLANLSFQLDDLLLLLFDRVEHGPDDGIVVDHQVTVRILRDGFGNHLLHGLRSETDVLAWRL